MSLWSSDISAAPRDRQILMRTTRSNQVFVTNWLEPTKHTPSGRFNGFSENAKTLLAWCEIPAFENDGSVPQVKAVHSSLAARGADESAVSNSIAVTTNSPEDRTPLSGAVSVTAQRGAGELVPVCPALIDDCGSGA